MCVTKQTQGFTNKKERDRKGDRPCVYIACRVYGQYLQLSEDMFRKWLKNRNHYKNKSLNILLLQTSECKQLLLPKIYSSCILPEPTSSNDSSHSLPNPGQPKCVIIISTIEGLAFRPWKQRGNWRPSGQFHFQTPRGSFRGFTAYPRPQTTIIIIIMKGLFLFLCAFVYPTWYTITLSP